MVQDHYAARYTAHRWKIPHAFNIADACCRRWADAPERTAILAEDAEGNTASHSYIELMQAANRLSNALRARGIQAGDRVIPPENSGSQK